MCSFLYIMHLYKYVVLSRPFGSVNNINNQNLNHVSSQGLSTFLVIHVLSPCNSGKGVVILSVQGEETQTQRPKDQIAGPNSWVLIKKILNHFTEV